MYGLLVAILVIVSLMLIVVVLLQGGRGGLGEALGGSGSQSLFGGGTNMAIAKFTAIGVGVFFATSLILARLSTARGRSVLEQVPMSMPEAVVPTLGGETADSAAAVTTDPGLAGTMPAMEETVEAVQQAEATAQESAEAVLMEVEPAADAAAAEVPAVQPEEPAP